MGGRRSNPVGHCSHKNFHAAIPLQKGNIKGCEDLTRKKKDLGSYYTHPLKFFSRIFF